MVHVVVDAVDAVVLSIGAIGLLLCGIVFAALWIKQGLEKRRKK